MKTLVVASGKGGTGKTTTTANLGRALAAREYKVALLDMDTAAPNLPRAAGVDPIGCVTDDDWFYPKKSGNVEVFSTSYLIPADIACSWTGNRRMEIAHELLDRVKWDDPDILICDSPPGMSDEFLGVLQYTLSIDGILIVTTGARASLDDARRLIGLLRTERYARPIVGAVENMGHTVARNNRRTRLLSDGLDIEQELGVPLIGSVPYRQEVDLNDYDPIVDQVLAFLEVAGEVEESTEENHD